MAITHAKARKLINFSADKGLTTIEKALLSTHLDTCAECRIYSAEIADIERLLLPLMKKQWDLQPAPLSVGTLKAQSETKLSANTTVTIRRVMVSLVFALFMLSAWQFALSGNPLLGQSTAINLPVQTPSIQSTSTEIDFENCATMLYTVQANDTLASIAERFSISKEAILALNGMNTEIVHTAMTLSIPVCRFTPTSTVNSATLTTTYTPVADPATSSPQPSS